MFYNINDRDEGVLDMSCGTCDKCGKCHKGKKGLCPISFGLAVGITCAIFFFIWAIWMMYHGVQLMPAEHRMMVSPHVMGNVVRALWILLKGFIFGAVIALLYDLFICCCKLKCCKRSDDECSCGCGCECCSSSGKKKISAGSKRNIEL